MAIAATDTIESVVEGKKPVLNLNAGGKGRSYKTPVKPGQKYYDMPLNLINQQIALLYGTKEAPKNRGAAANRLLPYLNGQAYASAQWQGNQHRQVFTKKISLPKILCQLATKMVKSPAPRSSRLYSGKGDYEWN